MLSTIKIPFTKFYIHRHRWIEKQTPFFEFKRIDFPWDAPDDIFIRFGQQQFLITTLPF